MAVGVQIHKGESESSCVYYLFLFSGWWFGNEGKCTVVALNGKYNPSPVNYGFRWCSPANGNYMLPNRSEMKIRRQ
jgi:hypothetical protein